MKRRALNLLSLAIFTALAPTASAQVLTVTTSADVVDVGSAATVAQLPGPDGVVSLREALLVSDNTPGHQTVAFAIPQSLWYLPGLFPGLCLLEASTSWSASDPVTIDGTTQTAFTGDTNPDGNELVLYGLPLYLGGDGTVVTGLHESRVEVGGSGATIHGNTGGMHVVAYSGSGSSIHDNEAYTIELDRSDGNLVVRNTTARVRIVGVSGLPAANNVVGGPDPADRNFITGWGNYGQHGVPAGTCVELYYSLGTLIQNNYIGTVPDGLSIGNVASTIGVGIYDDNHDLLVRDNLIAIRAVGVYPVAGVIYGQEIYLDSYGGGSGIEICGNTLGLDAAGQPFAGGVNGIHVSRYALEHAQDVRLGGTAPGEGNVIAGHLSTGVLMVNGPGIVPGAAVRVSGNSLYANGGPGIDLTPNTWTFGPTPNDPLDADVGANGLQNHPVLSSADLAGSFLHLVGALGSSPFDDFTLEFFASPACDPSGFGQGQVFLGSAQVTTDGAGDAGFDVLLSASAPVGWVVTATATLEPLGATSEFSACVAIAGAGLSTYCTAGTSTAGCAALISGAGVPSASAPSGFALLADDVEGQRDGLFFFGTGGRQANPWGNGTSFQCVVPPVVRAGLLVGSGTPGQCDGAFSQDLNALWAASPNKNPGPGAVTQAQLWYRDPQNSSNQTTSLSDAIEFTLAP